MRSAFGIVFHVIAGFFFYGVGLLAFVNGPSMGAKWAIVAIFAVIALLALVGGLALRRFRNWRADVGVVLLSASAFTAFVIFTFACLLLSDEFRRLVRPDTLTLFSDYVSGIAVTALGAVVGWSLWAANKRDAERAASTGK